MPPIERAQRFVFRRLNSVTEPLARSRLSGPFPLGLGLTLIEATGRRSGVIRTRPVLGLRCGTVVLAGTVRTSSDWIANLRAAPEVTIWIDGSPAPATAEISPLPRGALATVGIS